MSLMSRSVFTARTKGMAIASPKVPLSRHLDAKSLNSTNGLVTENVLVITRREKVALSRSRAVAIPQGALAAKRPTPAKMAAIHKGVVPRLERAKHRLQWARTCSISWRRRWRAWWNSSSNRTGENAVALQAHPQARVNRTHHRRPILTQTPTTNPAITAKAGLGVESVAAAGPKDAAQRAGPKTQARVVMKPRGPDVNKMAPALTVTIHSMDSPTTPFKRPTTLTMNRTIHMVFRIGSVIWRETGDKMGDRINDAFASIFSSSLRRRPNDKALLDTANKYPRPVNVPKLAVPKTNDVIWERMRKGSQIVDTHLQKVQTCVSKTLVPMISIMNEIGEGGSNRLASQHSQKITDALRLGCGAFSLLSQVRKEVIRNDLNHTFAKLCTWKYEVGTDHFFSADVIKQLELTETSRQFNDLTARPSTSYGNHHVDKYRKKNFKRSFKNKSTKGKPYKNQHKHGKNKGETNEVRDSNMSKLTVTAVSLVCAPTDLPAPAPAKETSNLMKTRLP